MNPPTTKTNNYELEVQNYSVRIYPGQSSKPQDNIDGKDLGYVILGGEGTPFVIRFLPDGSDLLKPGYNEGLKFVQMYMNWCQLEGLLTLLKRANSVQALYHEDNGVPWAVVEGQFVRKKGKRK